MKQIAQNKQAYFNYEVLEYIEAGIILTGPEIKSIRTGNVNLKGSYVSEEKGELFIKGMHISEYPYMKTPQDPLRERKLLLHKKEVSKLIGKLSEQGLAIIPLKIYLKKGYCKLLIGLCKGKKKYDKRKDLKKKAQDMEVKRALKNY